MNMLNCHRGGCSFRCHCAEKPNGPLLSFSSSNTAQAL